MRFYLFAASLLVLVSFAARAGGQQPEAAQKNLAEVGKRLSNPLSDVWALFARFTLNSSDGNATSTDPKVGGAMLRRRGSIWCAAGREKRRHCS